MGPTELAILVLAFAGILAVRRSMLRQEQVPSLSPSWPAGAPWEAERPVATFLRRPSVRWWVGGYHLALVVVLAGLLWGSTYPGGWTYDFWLLLLLVPFGLTWFVALLVVASVLGRSARWRWALAAPVLVVSAVGLGGSPVLLEQRWSRSEAAFATVVELRHHDLGPTEVREVDLDRVGSYAVARAEQRGRALVIEIVDAGFVAPAGFAFLPDGPDLDVLRGYEGPTLRRVDGDWYVWTSQF